MAEARMWTETEIRDLIAIEASTGQTMAVLNSAISGGELNKVVSQIAMATYSGLEAQTDRVALTSAEMEATKAAIEAQQATIQGVLNDCRAFVTQTQSDTNEQKQAMTAEVDSLQTKIQDIVKFLESVTDTVSTRIRCGPATCSWADSKLWGCR